MKFLAGLVLFSVAMFGSLFIVRANHFDEQKIACMRAGGNGKVLHSELGMPVGYKCMRMHLVMKFKKGEYK